MKQKNDMNKKYAGNAFLLFPKFIWAALLLIQTPAIRIFANGDPVMHYSSLCRVANPDPLPIPEIIILDEQINIKHVDGYNCFDITYHFENTSDKDFPDIHYGFPIDYYVSDEKESYIIQEHEIFASCNELGWSDNLIKDIAFTFNDSELKFHSAKESVREAGYEVSVYEDGLCDSIKEDAINRRWFYTLFSIGPKSKATLNVRYKVYTCSSQSLFGGAIKESQYVRVDDSTQQYTSTLPLFKRYFSPAFYILYDFTPARNFGNPRNRRSYRINVDIDLSNLKNPFIWGGPEDRLRCYVSRIVWDIPVYDPAEIEPLRICVLHSVDTDRTNVERKIAPFIVPADKYRLRKNKDSIKIDFSEPMFVSEIACDIDTAAVNSINSIITYADGRVKKYHYFQRPPDRLDYKILSPVIITITDIYNDALLWDEEKEVLNNMSGKLDDPYFKIKSIKLVFDGLPAPNGTSASCRNIRVLDSRFAK